MVSKHPCVYMMASKKDGVIYIGVTSDLIKRVHQHKSGETKGFTSAYKVTRLVWFEQHGSMEAAISREKQMKKWKRAYKVRAIETDNPHWYDLYSKIL